MKMLAVFTVTLSLSGCALLRNEPAPAPVHEVRLTAETVQKDEFGTVIIVLFPIGTEEPKVFINEETGQWATGAAVKR